MHSKDRPKCCECDKYALIICEDKKYRCARHAALYMFGVWP